MFNLPNFFKLTTVQRPILTSIRQLGDLSNLQPAFGATHNYKRLGRGPSSGKGKTSGRGQKGQKARGKVPKFVEGGQTPFFKQFKISGFRNLGRKDYYEINLLRIQDFWNNGRIPLNKGDTLTIKTMKDCGLINGTLIDGVKILGDGNVKYDVPLNIEASKATSVAIETIKKNGYDFTARFFTRLGLRAHVNPNKFLLKYGYIPLQARPKSQRDIKYYSDESRGGYLIKDKSILLDKLDEAKIESTKPKEEINTNINSLAKQLERATKNQIHSSSNPININDL
ncbi:unnamed protein product [Candida verbasci]|uniref:Large ribosomal subunit protein uL15/eL18 domain-containing protein n=1 Tax=Candida verbasci TaxID=1227364 RepID=A0A9W4TTW6_9ASCO|nr:unnamed protein product [Candida verbasci]